MTYEEMDAMAIPVKWLADHHLLIVYADDDGRYVRSPYDHSIPKVHIAEDVTNA